MHAYKAFSILAIAGSALAAPWGEGNYWVYGDNYRAAATVTETATAFTTVTAANNFFGGFGQQTTAAPTPTTTAAAISTHPHTRQSQAPASQAPAASPVAASPAAASPSASPSAAASSGGSTGTYMDVVSEWRSKMGLGALTESDTLQANALKTVTDGQGQMVHELNPGSMAQVLAPGDANNFENVYVGGWLCEEPSLPGLDGICSTMSAGWDYEGQTGHAAILSNPQYTKIGCALNYGIWGCDLA